MAGVDAQGRQHIACWDVSACWDRGSGGAGKAIRVASQASEHNVQALRLAPHDPELLVTCGKNSVRLYRLQGGQLRGVSVSMQGVDSPLCRRPYSCGSLATAAAAPGAVAAVGEVFTCLAFEQQEAHAGAPLPPQQQAQHLLVGTLSGAGAARRGRAAWSGAGSIWQGSCC